MLCLTNYKEGAAALQWSNIQRLLCFAQFYSEKLDNSAQLQRLWFLVIQIVINMLQTLEVRFYAFSYFLQFVFSFIKCMK